MRSLFVLFIVMSMLLTACLPSDDIQFPPDSQTTTTQRTTETTTVNAWRIPDKGLIVASTYSEEAIEYLALFYYAKFSGVFPDNSSERIGLDVNLNELNQFHGNFPLSILRISPGSTGQDQLKAMVASGTEPDLFFVDSVVPAALEGRAADLTNIASSEVMLASGHTYPVAVEGVKMNGRMYGIPEHMTVPLMVAERERAEDFGLVLPGSAGWSTTAFVEEAEKVRDRYEDEDDVLRDTALDSAARLLEYLPGTADPMLGWSGWNGMRFAFEKEAFTNASKWVESLVRSGISADRTVISAMDSDLPEEADETAVRYSGQSVFQITDSSILQENNKSRITSADHSLQRLPFLDNERVAAHIHAICISPAAAQYPVVIDFAIFMGLHPDARLLLSRFTDMKGVLPVITDTAVWNTTVSEQTFGTFFSAYRPLLMDAYPTYHHLRVNQKGDYIQLYREAEKEWLSGQWSYSQFIDHIMTESR